MVGFKPGLLSAGFGFLAWMCCLSRTRHDFNKDTLEFFVHGVRYLREDGIEWCKSAQPGARGFLIDQQELELFAQQGLELCQRQARRDARLAAKPPHNFKAALVDRAPVLADV